MRKRLVVFDLDGTLAPIGQGMSQENIDLLNKISEKGMKIAICSGKPAYYPHGYVCNAGISDAMILGENGAEIQFGIHLPPQIYGTLPYERSVKSALRLSNSVYFVPSGLTKYDGLQKLTQMTGIMADEMIAVGDGVNDGPMFSYAGLSLGIGLSEEDLVDKNFASVTESLEYILSMLEEKEESQDEI